MVVVVRGCVVAGSRKETRAIGYSQRRTMSRDRTKSQTGRCVPGSGRSQAQSRVAAGHDTFWEGGGRARDTYGQLVIVTQRRIGLSGSKKEFVAARVVAQYGDLSATRAMLRREVPPAWRRNKAGGEMGEASGQIKLASLVFSNCEGWLPVTDDRLGRRREVLRQRTCLLGGGLCGSLGVGSSKRMRG